jgi:hypothetical protein
MTRPPEMRGAWARTFHRWGSDDQAGSRSKRKVFE